MKFQINDIVKISPEWANCEEELNYLYEVVDVNEVTNRVHIRPLFSGLSIPGIEVVAEYTVEFYSDPANRSIDQLEAIASEYGLCIDWNWYGRNRHRVATRDEGNDSISIHHNYGECDTPETPLDVEFCLADYIADHFGIDINHVFQLSK